MNQRTIDLAVGMARVTTRERIVESAVWLPFKLLYDELTAAKEIVTLVDLPNDEKEKYWEQSRGIKQTEKVISGIRIKEPQFKRIWICQALYAWDLVFKREEPF